MALFKSRALASILMPSESISPDWIVYWNTSIVLPLPEAYVAVWFVLPTTRVSVGEPLELSTMTCSVKVAVTDTTSPVFRRLPVIPTALVIATLSILGGVVSIITLLTEALERPPASSTA